MCNNRTNNRTNVPSVTLQTAVLLQVKEFAAANTAFSVYDITRAIRNKTTNGGLEIPEVEVSSASFRFDIPHTRVKALFDDLWQTGVFDPDFILTRKFVNNKYFEYTPETVNQWGVPATVLPPAVAAPIPNVVVTQGKVTATLPLPRTVVVDRIRNYLDNCANRGDFYPTMRNVQSAIKRDVSTGLSCAQIQDIIINELGRKVIVDWDYVSASRMA